MSVVAATTSRATQLLADLGDTTDQVADNLTRLGIRGQRGDCGTCPIAVYLQRNIVGADDVIVGELEAKILYADGHSEFVDLTEAVTQFVIGFDDGDHDQLQMRSTHRASVDAVHNHLGDSVADHKMPVDHPLNCRCKECRE